MLLQIWHRKVHGTLQREVALITGGKTLTKKLLGVAIVLTLLGCDNGSTSSDHEQESKLPVFEYGTLIDSRDQAQYKTIRIGTQNWMAENLRYSYFDNDDVSCEDGLSSKCDSLGRFYSWAEAMDTLNSDCGVGPFVSCSQGKYAVPKHFRGICPEGWRIPTIEDWSTLIDYVGGPDSTCDKLMARDRFYCGYDAYGFNALPINYPTRIENGRFCYSLGSDAIFWGVSEGRPLRFLLHAGRLLSAGDLVDAYCYKRFSIRCIEGESLEIQHDSYKTEYNDSVLVDERDGQTYKVVSIGNEVWMAENLNYEYKEGELSVCHKEGSVDCQKYGRLYTWKGAMGLDDNYRKDTIGVYQYPHQGICPEGWHIPSVDEFKKLFDAIGGYTADANGIYISGAALRSVDGWGKDGDGTDLLGFSALPAGITSFDMVNDEIFRVYGSETGFWSDLGDDHDITYPYAFYLSLRLYKLDGKQDFFHDGYINWLMSVRCVKD